MYIYCKKCNKHTSSTFPKKLIVISKNKVKGKSKCAISLTERTFIDETESKYDLESELKIYLQCFADWYYKIKTYCLKCKTNTENIDPDLKKKKKLTIQSICSICKKKSRFVKEQDAKSLLSNLGIKTPLNKIPLLNVLF